MSKWLDTQLGYDRIINVFLSTVPGDNFDNNLNASSRWYIGCNNYSTVDTNLLDKGVKIGQKPDISVTYSQVGEGTVYQVSVRICNMNLPIADIRKYQRMKVEVGYKDYTMTSFVCDVYSSYVESPNPDGITVFYGIVAQALTVSEGPEIKKYSIWDYKPCALKFEGNTVKVDDLFKQVAKKLGIGYNNKLAKLTANGEKFMETEIPTEGMQVAGDSAGILIKELYRCIKAIIDEKNTNGENIAFIMNVDSSGLWWYISGGEDSRLTVAETEVNAVTVDEVDSLSFSGPMLTVIAPYNPLIKPFSIIELPANFFNGQQLPIATPLTPEIDYKGMNNLYSVTKMDVSFSTNGNENQMNLLAIPIQYGTSLGNVKGIQKVREPDIEALVNKLSEDKKKEGTVEIVIKGKISDEIIAEKLENEVPGASSIYSRNYPSGEIFNIGQEGAVTKASEGSYAYATTSLTYPKIAALKYGVGNIKIGSKNTGVPKKYLWPFLVLSSWCQERKIKQAEGKQINVLTEEEKNIWLKNNPEQVIVNPWHKTYGKLLKGEKDIDFLVSPTDSIIVPPYNTLVNTTLKSQDGKDVILFFYNLYKQQADENRKASAKTQCYYFYKLAKFLETMEG